VELSNFSSDAKNTDVAAHLLSLLSTFGLCLNVSRNFLRPWNTRPFTAAVEIPRICAVSLIECSCNTGWVQHVSMILLSDDALM
jgi:hypothetical protein